MENLDRQITLKFNLVERMLLLLEKTLGSCQAIKTSLQDFNELKTNFFLKTRHFFSNARGGEEQKLAASVKYEQVVASEDFLSRLGDLVERVLEALEVVVEKEQKPAFFAQNLKRMFEQFFAHKTDCTARAVTVSHLVQAEALSCCSDCLQEFSVCAEMSELFCPDCGKVQDLFGTIFDEAQFFIQEGQKSRSGIFNPNRHFHYWMEHILAREPFDELGNKNDPDNACGEKLLKELRERVLRERLILRHLTVADVRRILKNIGRTDLNKNVALILRQLTGIGPPEISEALYQRVEKLFSQAIEAEERIRQSHRHNRNYYPYYIFKIFDAILSKNDESRRILYYIHLQDQATLEKNDRDWAQICDFLPEIEWAPTRIHKDNSFRPSARDFAVK